MCPPFHLEAIEWEVIKMSACFLRGRKNSIIFLCALFFLQISCSERSKMDLSDCNLLFIVVDSLRADHLGYAGYPRDTSPFIDSLAGESIVFTECRCQRSQTLPSFATIFTSLYASQHQVLRNEDTLDESLVTLAEILKAHGFYTAGIVGSMILNKDSRIDQGFDYFDAGHGKKQWWVRDGEEVNEIAMKWLKAHRKEKFFLLLHYWDVHSDYNPPEQYRQLFCDPDYDGPVNGTEGQHRLYNNLEMDFNEKDLEYLRGLYDAQIRYFDSLFQEFYRFLQEMDLADSTLIIFTGDHGESLGTHRFIGHGWLQENQLRIPLFIRFPGKTFPPGRIDALLETTDLSPGILDMYGIEIPADMVGKSFLPLIKKEKPRIRETVYAEFFMKDGKIGACSLQKNHYKIIKKRGNREALFYDLARDTEEIHPVTEAHPVKAELVEMLNQKWKKELSGNKKILKKMSREDERTKQMLRELGYVE